MGFSNHKHESSVQKWMDGCFLYPCKSGCHLKLKSLSKLGKPMMNFKNDSRIIASFNFVSHAYKVLQ